MANRHYIYIWDAKIYGIKRDFNSALKKARALAQQKAEPCASLLRFADTAYTRSDIKKLEPAVVHYLQHLKENIISSKTAAFRVALHEHEPHGQILLNILMIEAMKHGLVLFDEVAELVILPDGSIYSEDVQLIARLKESSRFPVTLKKFYRLLQKDVGALLMKHGFLADKQESWLDDEFYVEYNKVIKMGKLTVSMSFKKKKGSFEPHLNFEIIEDNMIAIAQKSDFKYSMAFGGGVSLNVFSILKLRDDEFLIDSWKKFEEFLNILTKSVLQWSDPITDIKSIDSLLNGFTDDSVRNKIHSSSYTPYALIAARLAGNPNFEQLALDLGAYGPDSGRIWGVYGDNVAMGWPKLVNYLREEIKPLEDWPDGFLTHLQGKESHDNTRDSPITMEQLDEHFKIKMGELANHHGFVLTKLTQLREDEDVLKTKYFIVVYDKDIDMGKLSLEIIFGDFSPNISFIIKEETMMSVAEKLNFSERINWDDGIVLNISAMLGSENIINSWQKLEQLISLLQNSVMRWSDSMNNIRGIEALLNGGEVDTATKFTHSRYLYNFYALIAARLAGNPHFEELTVLLSPYRAVSKNIRDYNNAHIEIAESWPTLVSYLRDEIKPLADTSVDAVLPAHFVCSNLERLIDPNNQKGFPTILVQFADLVQNQAKELFMEHRFLLIEKPYLGGSSLVLEYDKTIKNGKLYLIMEFEEKKGDFKVSIYYRIIEDNMIVIAQHSDFSYAMVQNGLFLNLNGVLNPKDQIWINNWTTFEALIHLLKETVLKWSDTIDDIKGIDALINRDTNEAIKNNVHSSCYTPFALIAARLANNPNFEELAVSLGTYGAGSGRAWGKFSHAQVAVAWPKLVKYLREEVKPLI